MSARVKMAKLCAEVTAPGMQLNPVRVMYAAIEFALWDAAQRDLPFPAIYAEQNWHQYMEPAKRAIVAAAEAV